MCRTCEARPLRPATWAFPNGPTEPRSPGLKPATPTVLGRSLPAAPTVEPPQPADQPPQLPALSCSLIQRLAVVRNVTPDDRKPAVFDGAFTAPAEGLLRAVENSTFEIPLKSGFAEILYVVAPRPTVLAADVITGAERSTVHAKLDRLLFPAASVKTTTNECARSARPE